MDKKSRILVISNLYPPEISGGFEIECQEVVEGLRSRGFEVGVLTTGEPCGDNQIFRKLKMTAPIQKKVVGVTRWQKLQLLKENDQAAKEVIEEFKPDLVFHWSTLRIGLGAALAASAIPLVWRFGDVSIKGSKSSKWGFSPRRMVGFCLDHLIYPGSFWKKVDFSYVSCISHHVKEELMREGFPVEQAAVHYRGIHVEQFPVKKDLGGISYPPRLLYVGRLHPEKGVDEAIQAAHSIGKVSLTIIGEGQEDYVRYLKTLKGPARIDFRGYVPREELSVIYQEHDIFLFPTTGNEGQGATFLEAMASGLPVVATEHGGHGEILRKAGLGVLYPLHHIELLKKGIEKLLEDSSFRIRQAIDGRRFVETELSFLKYLDGIEEFLCRIPLKSSL